MIELKTENELDKMRVANKIVAQTLDLIEENLKPGISTEELDRLAADFIRSKGAEPAFLGYHNYPKSICVSIDDEVVHGIPSPDRMIREGQLVSVDVGSYIDGFNGDSARSFFIGEAPPEAQRLLDTTKRALENGIARAKAGNRLGDISHAIQQTAEDAGFNVVRDLVGHGIGRQMHEDPQVPNYGQPGKGVELKAGMTIAIEPMVNAGDWRVRTKPDRWTIVTADGSLSAHFEHTIVIGEHGAEILSLSN